MDPKLYHAAVDGDLSLLHEAIESDSELLLHRTTNGDNVLHIAVRSARVSFISYVMHKCPSILAQPNSNGETPLHIAAKEGSIEMLFLLLECLKSACTTEELFKMKKKLHDEEGRGTLWAVPHVLDVPPLTLYTGPVGRTTLHKAIIMNSSEDEICEWAKTFPEMIKKKDENGWTPLHYASHLGYSVSVHILLDIDTSCAYETNMHGMYGHLLAAHKGHYSLIREFYMHCPDCFDLFDSQGRSALHIAAEAGNLEVFKFLIEKTHHHFNLIDNRGYTPLLLASKSQNEMLLASLRDHLKVRDSKVLLRQLEGLNVNHEMPIPSEIHVAPKIEEVAIQLLQLAFKETEARETRKNDVSRRIKDKASIHLIVATLIATVSFAAGLNMPGGYRADSPHQGMAILTKKTAFQAFLVSNSLAFCFSAASIATHFLMIIERRVRNRAILLSFALFLTSVGLVGMVVAFISGTIVVLVYSVALWVASAIIGFFFFPVLCIFLVFRVITGLPSRKKVLVDDSKEMKDPSISENRDKLDYGQCGFESSWYKFHELLEGASEK